MIFPLFKALEASEKPKVKICALEAMILVVKKYKKMKIKKKTVSIERRKEGTVNIYEWGGGIKNKKRREKVKVKVTK